MLRLRKVDGALFLSWITLLKSLNTNGDGHECWRYILTIQMGLEVVSADVQRFQILLFLEIGDFALLVDVCSGNILTMSRPQGQPGGCLQWYFRESLFLVALAGCLALADDIVARRTLVHVLQCAMSQ
jgi:hypothetical protein